MESPLPGPLQPMRGWGGPPTKNNGVVRVTESAIVTQSARPKRISPEKLAKKCHSGTCWEKICQKCKNLAVKESTSRGRFREPPRVGPAWTWEWGQNPRSGGGGRTPPRPLPCASSPFRTLGSPRGWENPERHRRASPGWRGRRPEAAGGSRRGPSGTQKETGEGGACDHSPGVAAARGSSGFRQSRRLPADLCAGPRSFNRDGLGPAAWEGLMGGNGTAHGEIPAAPWLRGVTRCLPALEPRCGVWCDRGLAEHGDLGGENHENITQIMRDYARFAKKMRIKK